jgi:hypothetical protein
MSWKAMPRDTWHTRDTGFQPGFQPVRTGFLRKGIPYAEVLAIKAIPHGLKTRVTGMLLSAPVLAIALIGCEREKGISPTRATTQASYRSGTAIIRGAVTLAGKPPVMATIPNQPCHEGAQPLKEETVVANDAGHLQNVIVYLEDAPPAPTAQNLPPVVLDQVNCHYVPHVLALRTGRTLHVTTSDPTLHNVHGMCSINEAFNFALVAAGQSRDLSFPQPELFPIRCDVHPWMKAYVQVFSHPWFAVTDKSGHFEIKDVPSGNYTLVAWQEKYGILRQSVKIDDGKITDASFTYQSGL